MAKKEITPASSPADIAQAQQELQQAQQRLEEWKRSKPNIVEVFEGRPTELLGYTLGELSDEARRIAADYDYVNFGRIDTDLSTVSGTTIGVGSNRFFVKGLGADTLLLSPRETGVVEDLAVLPGGLPGQLSPIDTFTPGEAAFVLGNNPGDPTPVQGGSTDPVNPPNFSTGSAETSIGGAQPTPVLSRAQPPGGLPGQPSPITTLTPGEAGAATATADGSDSNNQTPVTASSPRANTDDSGSIAGTGSEAGLVPDQIESDGQPLTDPEERIPGGLTGQPSPITTLTPSEEAAFTPSSPSTVDIWGGIDPFGGIPGDDYEKSEIEVKPNVLHDYANWTYNISMYMLTLQQTADICLGGIPQPPGDGLMFRSGGASNFGALSPGRDYFIQNFRFTSIVGPNARTTKSSNNFDLEMEVLEPYGVAMLAEMIQLADRKGIKKFSETSFLIEINFKGYNDSGVAIENILKTPKYILVKIIDVNFKITSAGTVYTIKMVPYAHAPLTNVGVASLDSSISLSGSNYSELIASLEKHMNDNEIAKSAADGRDGAADTFKFVINDKELAESSVGFSYVDSGQVSDISRKSFPGGEYIGVNKNSLIRDVVANLALATDFGAKYNTKGFRESEPGDNRKIRMIKLIPNEIPDQSTWLETSRRYRRDYIFKIEVQELVGFDVAGYPVSEATEYVKEYQWIFTGQNQDILNFDASYNLQYFYILSWVFTEEKSQVLGTPSAEPGFEIGFGPGQVDPGLAAAVAAAANVNEATPAVKAASDSPDSNNIYNRHRGNAYAAAADLMDNILTNPNGDMIAIDLEIVGDPDWIPQDSSILPVPSSSDINGRDRFGSIAIDRASPLVMIKFKTPRDYNSETGLMKIDVDRSYIEGLYRVITVESTFNNGSFKQNLQMVRVMNQKRNKPVDQDASDL